jgi:hypothetical protein
VELRVRLGDRGQRAGRTPAVGLSRWRPAVRLDRRRTGARNQAGRAGIVLSRQPVAERASDWAAQRGTAGPEAASRPVNPAQTRRDALWRVTMKRALVGGPGAPGAIPWPWKSGRERWVLRPIGRGRLRDIPDTAPTPAMPRMRRHGPAPRRDVHLGRPALHEMRRRTAAPADGASRHPVVTGRRGRNGPRREPGNDGRAPVRLRPPAALRDEVPRAGHPSAWVTRGGWHACGALPDNRSRERPP